MIKYETYKKIDGKWYFMGWYPIMNKEFLIETKKRGKYTYNTYKWLNGEIETERLGSSVEVNW